MKSVGVEGEILAGRLAAVSNWVELIRDVPDFPKKGIIFKDITPVLGDAEAFRSVLNDMEKIACKLKPDMIVGPEARGFIFGCPLAVKLGAGFAPVRKKGKLPWKTIQASYELEYGTDTIEMHEDAIKRGQRVLIVDDLLATGGTAAAIAELIHKLGGEVVGYLFCIELAFIPGRKKLAPAPVHSLLSLTEE